MKLHILSDLHNEFDGYEPSPSARLADVVILAGDIDVGLKGLEWADRTFNCPVIYVPGNHEFYHHNLERTLKEMRNFRSDKVRFLDQDELAIGDVRILCATAWTDFAATGDQAIAAIHAKQMLNDFSYISTDENRKIQPIDLINISTRAKSWLRSKLDESFSGKTVVITHHAPLLKSLEHSPYPKSHINAAFANHWPELFDEKVDLWVHGHTHIAIDYVFNATRVISNPRGYPGEDTGFNPDLVVDI
ncbi:TPA: metallophosphoesterase [Pseudomonas aeruginosa]|nr:metallophosphoesterase [Pseudomonas aeruginosa]